MTFRVEDHAGLQPWQKLQLVLSSRFRGTVVFVATFNKNRYPDNMTMHTVWVRLNAVVFFGLTVLLGLSSLAALSKVGHTWDNQPIVHKLELQTLRSLKSQGGVDRVLFSFDVKADMRPAFHWNIKQLFVYVVASYSTESKEVNEIVVWDKIMEAVDPKKVIDEESVLVKYALVDHGQELRGKEVTLKLMWDHMPITGLLHQGQQGPNATTTFTLPTEYKSR